MEAEAEFFKSKAVSRKEDRNMGRVMILCFFGTTGGILVTQDLVLEIILDLPFGFPINNIISQDFFSKAYFSHTPTNLPLFMSSWNMQEIGIRTYFGSVTVESVRIFCHFAFWRHGFKLATFFIVHMNCIF